jgi:hypothetical protein
MGFGSYTSILKMISCATAKLTKEQEAWYSEMPAGNNEVVTTSMLIHDPIEQQGYIKKWSAKYG